MGSLGDDGGFSDIRMAHAHDDVTSRMAASVMFPPSTSSSKPPPTSPSTLPTPAPTSSSSPLPTSSSLLRCSLCLKASSDSSSLDAMQWQATSPLARFGLDIGGTLCKVVLFEPQTLKTSKHEENLQPGANEKATPGRATGVLEGFEQRNGCACMGESSGVTHENNVGEVGGAMHGSMDTSTSDTCAMCGSVIVESSRSRAKKIWASSHDPIHLPGRGTLLFKRFETWRMEEFLSLAREHSLVTGTRAIGATGGGARKFGDQFLNIAGLRLNRADELTSLVRGIDFLARFARDDCFEFPFPSYEGGSIQRPWQSPDNSSSDEGEEIDGPDRTADQEGGEGRSEGGANCRLLEEVGFESDRCQHEIGGKRGKGGGRGRTNRQGRGRSVLEHGESLYPYLVVNIGSGVSILRVDSADKFQRVGGTSLGGSTFLGLTAVLTGCDSFKDAIALASRGDSTKVDMLVGDIYGGDYTEMGLAATTVASSFGKLAQAGPLAAAAAGPAALAKAALLMVTNTVGSLAMLHARPERVRRVLFAGSFMHGNRLAMRLLTVSIEFWSKGEMKAIFLRHEGHAGAIGALLSSLDGSDEVDNVLLSEMDGAGEGPGEGEGAREGTGRGAGEGAGEECPSE